MPTLMTDEQLELLIRQSKNNTAELRRIRVRIQNANHRAHRNGVVPTELDADAVEDWNEVTEQALANG